MSASTCEDLSKKAAEKKGTFKSGRGVGIGNIRGGELRVTKHGLRFTKMRAGQFMMVRGRLTGNRHKAVTGRSSALGQKAEKEARPLIVLVVSTAPACASGCGLSALLACAISTHGILPWTPKGHRFKGSTKGTQGPC